MALMIYMNEKKNAAVRYSGVYGWLIFPACVDAVNVEGGRFWSGFCPV